MSTVLELNETAQRVLCQAAQDAERTSGFVQRRSKLTGETFVQTLVFGFLDPSVPTLADLAQTAAALGVEITPQGLDQRFTREAADFLGDVLQRAIEQVVCADLSANDRVSFLNLLDRFKSVVVLDATQVTLPAVLAEVWRGRGGAVSTDRTESSVKLSVGWDLLSGRLRGPELMDGREHDSNAILSVAPQPEGSLRITDLGYFRLSVWAGLSERGAYWLSRFHTKTGFSDETGRTWMLDEFLAGQAEVRLDVPIFLGLTDRLPCRLVAVRVPPAVAETRRRRLRERAKGRGQTPSHKELALCDWTVYVTNVPPELLSIEEVLVLGRIRWQIELLFKLWKSELQIDEWRTKQPWRILCEVYAKLIGALLVHWIEIVVAWDLPGRSLFKVARTIRRFALELAGALTDPRAFSSVLDRIRRCVRTGCRLDKRRKHPSSYQLLSHFNSPSLA